MKKELSPFRLSLRISGYCLLLSFALDCYLFVTSQRVTDYVLFLVIAVLTALLSVAIGFYCGLRRLHVREEAELNARQVFHSIHYPQRSDFEQRANQHRNFA